MKIRLFFPLLIFLSLILGGCSPKELIPDEEGLVWKFKTGGEIWSSAVISGETILFGSDDSNLYALDLYTGEMEWQFETGGLVRGKPALGNKSIYITSEDGFLYALKSKNGELLWKQDIHNTTPTEKRNVYDYKLASPIIVGEVLYVGSADTNFYAIDANSGDVLWKFGTRNMIRSSPAYADGIVYFGSWDGNVYALDSDNGELLWSFRTTNYNQPSPLVVDGVVYVGSRQPYFFALDAATGEELWRVDYKASWVESSAVYQDGVLYVGSSDISRLRAIDSQTGEVLWDAAVTGFPWADPTVQGDKVYIGNINYSHGYMMAFDRATGEMLWKYETGDALDYAHRGNYSSPVVYQDTVFFGSLDGYFYAIQP